MAKGSGQSRRETERELVTLGAKCWIEVESAHFCDSDEA